MYRKVTTGFWTDSKVELMSSYDKLLLLYLFTAPHGNLAGCFEVTYRRIEVDTGLTAQQAEKAMRKLCELGVVDYRVETSEVLVRNWGKHNWTKSPKTQKALEKQIEAVSDLGLRKMLADEFESFFGIPYPYDIDTVSIGYEYPYISVSVSNPTTGKGEGVQGEGEPDHKPSKHKHGEYGNVLLTDDELQKLKEKFPDDWQERIADLDIYIGQKGAKYKSHYLTILSWDRRDSKQQKRGSGKYAKYD